MHNQYWFGLRKWGQTNC